ncbi:sodium:solute symporter [candidate division KSB1 bacterium]|nr:sodium:solute symporter [candidate division KSB1 bacterium]
MQPIDYAIILIYLAIITVLGVRFGGRIYTSRDYFLAGAGLPWWAVCLSVVATETSTLTFISLPGLAYISNLNFLQLGLGYIIGRIIVAFIFLPAYIRGDMSTSYELLANRFGANVRTLSSLIFIVTRLLADGVRLYATAIPLSIMTRLSLPVCIVILAMVTMLYTSIGGLRSVVWIDVVQTFIYVGGAVIAGFYILTMLPHGWPSAIDADKLQIFNLTLTKSLSEFMQMNYSLAASLIGGAFLSMASHGTDQIIVQRLLACKVTKDAQKALISSGVIVLVQFGIFLFLGLLLYAFYHGAAMPPDEILPRFIIEQLPRGLSGLIIAAVFAAAMSTLSSSLNSMASSTMFDLLLPHRKMTAKKQLILARLFTILWGIIFTGGAMLFRNKENPVVELGLAIASFTYGGVLGAFFLATMKSNLHEADILVSLWATIVYMTWFIGPSSGVLLILLSLAGIVGGWIFTTINRRARLYQLVLSFLAVVLFIVLDSPQIAWPWYVPVGTSLMLILGNLSSQFMKVKLFRHDHI